MTRGRHNQMTTSVREMRIMAAVAVLCHLRRPRANQRNQKPAYANRTHSHCILEPLKRLRKEEIETAAAAAAAVAPPPVIIIKRLSLGAQAISAVVSQKCRSPASKFISARHRWCHRQWPHPLLVPIFHLNKIRKLSMASNWRIRVEAIIFGAQKRKFRARAAARKSNHGRAEATSRLVLPCVFIHLRSFHQRARSNWRGRAEKYSWPVTNAARASSKPSAQSSVIARPC